jgi:hypothetical protein
VAAENLGALSSDDKLLMAVLEAIALLPETHRKFLIEKMAGMPVAVPWIPVQPIPPGTAIHPYQPPVMPYQGTAGGWNATLTTSNTVPEETFDLVGGQSPAYHPFASGLFSF